MSRRSSLFAISSMVALALVACSKQDKEAAPTASAGSAAAGSISAGSASGSAMAGSASEAGSGSGAAAGSGSDAVAVGSGDVGAVKFGDLSHEDKVKFMKTRVMPAMKAAFRKFDPKEFASFTCKTCHGKDPKATKYKMPSPELGKLDFAAIKKGEDKEWVEFMGKVVVPEMAKILGEKEMSDTEPDGFDCLRCHEQKK